MNGQSENKLPVTKTGYQFESESELREAKWLIEQGDYKDLDDFGAESQASLERLRAQLAAGRAAKQLKRKAPARRKAA